MRRLPKQRLYRGLLKANMITPKDIPLIERKLSDFKKYQQLNITFTNNRGHRWAEKLQAFARWLWENREIILQILGLVIVFAEDGTPTLVDENELDEKKLTEVKQNLTSRKPTKLTPSGETVEDFMQQSTSEAQEAGLYDIGLEDNPLVKSKPKKKRSKKNEVQPGEASSEAVGGLQSDDVQQVGEASNRDAEPLSGSD